MARHTWHKTTNRNNDAEYRALTAGARCLLRDLDEMLYREESLTANVSTLAGWFGLDRKTTREGIEAIAQTGLLTITKEERGKSGTFYTISDPEPTPNQPQTNPEPTPNQPQASPKPSPHTSANDADSSDASLNRIEEEEEIERPKKSDVLRQVNPEVERLCQLLADLIEANGCKRPFVIDLWRTEMDRLLRLDKKSPEEVEAVIRWCQADSFWRPNIMSVPKLREKFDQLRLQAERQKALTPKAVSNTQSQKPWEQFEEGTPEYIEARKKAIRFVAL